MKNIFKRFILLSTISVLMLSQGVNAFAFNPDTDSSIQIGNTAMYQDGGVSSDTLSTIKDYYNLIPNTVTDMLKEQNVKIYLIGKEGNPASATDVATPDGMVPAGSGHPLECTPASLGTAIDGLWFYCNENDLCAPLYIEKDPYDLNNLRMVERNGNRYLMYHGVLSQRDESTIDWDQLKQSYLEDASYFGMNYFAGRQEQQKEESQSPANGCSLCATSYGPTVEYDSDNNWAFCRVIKPGYTIYYTNCNIPEAVIHEAGHLLDWYSVPLSGRYNQTLFGISDSVEWKDLYSKYASYLSSVDDFTASNVSQGTSEAFAEAFRLTYQYPDKMRSECKEVYEYVLRQVQKYTGVGTQATFDAVDYAERYPDVKEALGTDKNALWNHFCLLGINEGRVAKFS